VAVKRQPGTAQAGQTGTAAPQGTAAAERAIRRSTATALASLGDDGGTMTAFRAVLDAAEPLERLVLRARDVEKAAQERFRAAWEE
jgi:hypothetical protein